MPIGSSTTAGRRFATLIALGLEPASRVLDVEGDDPELASLLLLYLRPGCYEAVAGAPEPLRDGLEACCGRELVALRKARVVTTLDSASAGGEGRDFILFRPRADGVAARTASTGATLARALRPLGRLVLWAGPGQAVAEQMSRDSGLVEVETGPPIEGATVFGHPDDESRRREIEIYRDVDDVHALPEIFHFWSQRFVRPKLEACGLSSFDDLFLGPLARLAEARPGSLCRVASLGAGNCDLELRLASALDAIGVSNIVFECLELNPHMLRRGAEAAEAAGLGERFVFREIDMEQWHAEGRYDACVASHSLHHFRELESIFGEVRRCLADDGVFLIHDMIGRNGHMRWPEVLEATEEIWTSLPARYKLNRQLQRVEEEFVNWDCSQDGSEGIRAQDILPLLLEHFEFELFVAFGGLIDPFVDRAFGHNFDPGDPEDRDVILRIAEANEEGLDSGRFKPTQMAAVLRTTPVDEPVVYRHWTPAFCLRRP